MTEEPASATLPADIQVAASSLAREQLALLFGLYNQGELAMAAEQAHALTQQFPRAVELWKLLGAASAGLHRMEQAERAFREACKLQPEYADHHSNLGTILTEQGKLDEAVVAYQRAIAIKPDHADAHYNLGNALREQNRLDEAVAALQRAIAIKPDHTYAHSNLGVMLQAQNRPDEAVATLQRAIAIKPDHADAHYNLGVVLQAQNRLDEVVVAYQSAIAINPGHAHAYSNLGVVLQAQNRLDEAVAAYQHAIAIKPDHADAHYNLGIVLQSQDRLDEAVVAYQRAIAIQPDHANAASMILHHDRCICDWRHHAALAEVIGGVSRTSDAVAPFVMLAVEDNAYSQLLYSRKYVNQKYHKIPLPMKAAHRPYRERIRIGYFSSDIHDHATMHLMVGLFREHDTSAFEVFIYSYGQYRNGALRAEAMNHVSRFMDVTDVSDPDVVTLAQKHHLDIAIDLKGYTQGTRSQLFAYRLAPIQVNFLGYPGTMGAPFMDYLVADPQVIPERLRQCYDEKVIYLPHSYQPNDDQRVIANTSTTRSDFGLPESGFVFCCFNKNYKISAIEFDIWMRILSVVEGSVLWLMGSNQSSERNLRREAAMRNVDPARLVFAPAVNHSEHLARHKHADLFLDTFAYNAHTTASDALWAGLPIVTKTGQQFAARVCGSLLHAVGLPDLVVQTDHEYEALAIRLATSPAALAGIKARLARNRLERPLFDTRRYTRNFETGLRQAYELQRNGQTPRDIWVAEVTSQPVV